MKISLYCGSVRGTCSQRQLIVFLTVNFSRSLQKGFRQAQIAWGITGEMGQCEESRWRMRNEEEMEQREEKSQSCGLQNVWEGTK